MGIEIKAATMRSYHTVRKHLYAFIRETFRTADIPFGLIEEDFFEYLRHYSVGKLRHSQGYYRKISLAVKSVCCLAYREGLTERQLFAHVEHRARREQTTLCIGQSLDEQIRGVGF